ncbi:DUF2946 family protein [Roseixanthobacter glucoisosaccharinicivorans]|uniref:DUF2946 family protein n=1 Tax=Roseixanthobacter glucoisosaccharinicivorans TaxID=3119923 RepID=UPI00372BD3AD
MILAKPRTSWRAWAAIAAAYLLVLQMLAVGLAAGAQAAQAAAQGPDAFGVICSSSPTENGSPTEGGAPAHHDGLDCCVLGCPMFGPAAAPPPAAEGFVAPVRHAAAMLRRGADFSAAPGQRRSPSRARAPPAIA